MNQSEYLARKRAQLLQAKADILFAYCLHFLLDKDEKWLASISRLSQELLDMGYETSFEHKKKALLVRNLFSQLEINLSVHPDQVLPRTSDLEGLPNAQS